MPPLSRGVPQRQNLYGLTAFTLINADAVSPEARHPADGCSCASQPLLHSQHKRLQESWQLMQRKAGGFLAPTPTQLCSRHPGPPPRPLVLTVTKSVFAPACTLRGAEALCETSPLSTPAVPHQPSTFGRCYSRNSAAGVLWVFSLILYKQQAPCEHGQQPKSTWPYSKAGKSCLLLLWQKWMYVFWEWGSSSKRSSE